MSTRRGSLLTAAAVLLLLTAAGSAAADAPRSTTFQGGPQHQGIVDQAPLGAALHQVWRSASPGFLSYPVIGDGVVLFTSSNQDGSGDKTLWGVSEATGAVRFHAPIDGDYGLSRLAYDAGRVFVTNFSGDVAAYSAVDGSRLWTVVQDAQGHAGEHQHGGIPNAVDGRVYVTMHDSDVPTDAIQALDEATGARVWGAAAPQDILDNAAPIFGGKLFVDVGRASSAALDTGTGATVIAAGTGDGEAQGGEATTAATDGSVLASGTEFQDDPNSAQVADAATGKRLYAEDPALDGPAIAGGLVLQHTHDRLWAVAERTGAAAWSWAADGKLSTPPLVVGGFVYIGTAEGSLVTLDLGTGRVLSHTAMGAAVGGGDLSATLAPPTGLGAGDAQLLVPTVAGLVALKGEPVAAAPVAPQPPATTPAGGSTRVPGGTAATPRRALALLAVPSRITPSALRRRGLALRVRLPSGGGEVTARLTVRGRRVVERRWRLRAGGTRVLRLRSGSARAVRGAAVLRATLKAPGQATRTLQRRVRVT